MPRSTLVLAVSLLLLLPLARHAHAADHAVDPALPVLTVTGVGVMEVDPDEVRIVLSVVTEGGEDDSLKSLTRDNSQRVNRLLDRMSQLGLTDSELETGRFSVQPRYTYPQRGGAPKIVGYSVENQVRIETTKLELAGTIIEEAVNAGANRVQSVSFGLSDERTARAETIAKATANARADAEALAAAAGVKLVRKLRIDLDQPQMSAPQPVMRMETARAMVAEDTAAPPPLKPGSVNLRASVTIVYETSG